MAKPTKPPKPPTVRALRQQLQHESLALTLAETTYTRAMLEQLTRQEALYSRDLEDRGWTPVSHGGAMVDAKADLDSKDPQEIRHRAYWMWRTNPHARGIIRTFEKFIVGREFGLDFADQTRGGWNEDRTKLVTLTGEEAPLMVRELWDDFSALNAFPNFMKELVRRSFRDGDAFVRRFERNGFILLRFVEPEYIQSPTNSALKGTVQPDDLTEDVRRVFGTAVVGTPTVIKDGIEYLTEDAVTVVAFHIKTLTGYERVPATQMIHAKPNADRNDPRGLLLLESVMRHITNYTQWEEYRLVLNKMRSAVALVRKVDGTAAQARALIDGRSSPSAAPHGREPQTTSGRREAAFAAGTIITAGAGVDWEYKTPNLQAADAEHDGRRFLLTIAAGMGLPEMLITGDWSNSNYSSSVESRTPAVREWEDWQEFFEQPVRRIINWVFEAAQEKLGLPKNFDKKVTIQWPILITKDAAKETERNAILYQSGMLSPQTWCAREDLVWEDEIENQHEALDQMPTTPIPAATGAGGGEEGEGEEDSVEEARTQMVLATARVKALQQRLTTTPLDPGAWRDMNEAVDHSMTMTERFLQAHARRYR